MEETVSAVEPMPTTYLSDPHVAARVSLLQRTPQAPKHLYERVLCGILQRVFTTNEGFSVSQEGMGMGSNLCPDFTVLRLLTKPGGSSYEYDFLVGETRTPGESWQASADHLHAVCANNNNDSKNVYGMLEVGFEIQFYNHDNHQFEAISDRMYLVDDVHNVIAWAQRIKANPMPFVNT
ncbi:hypothetical protein V500_04047 [Pseudogymnoascus sp. VKM F-4518 (FW-2643)]|nr:hypothetical protein V500_04047 [Pseudogymnoascus sp. VKM F-4518 (FW-2643)]